jgi:hypothetical protein
MSPPRKVAEAPMRIKMKENPPTKRRVCTKIFFLLPLLSLTASGAVISATERPVTKDIYPGIRGRTQGERKLNIPAEKEISRGTCSILTGPLNKVLTGLFGGIQHDRSNNLSNLKAMVGGYNTNREYPWNKELFIHGYPFGFYFSWVFTCSLVSTERRTKHTWIFCNQLSGRI